MDTAKLVERSELVIKEGMEDDFVSKMQERGLPILRGMPGVNDVQFGRGLENPDKFLLLVEWTEMAAHAAFRGHALYPEFSQLLKPFIKGAAMEHFTLA